MQSKTEKNNEIISYFSSRTTNGRTNNTQYIHNAQFGYTRSTRRKKPPELITLINEYTLYVVM